MIDYSHISANPIEWSALKWKLRQDDEEQKSELMALALESVAEAERITEASFVARDLTVIHYEKEPAYFLPRGPLNSIESVTDGDGIEIAEDDYSVEEDGNFSYLVIDVDHAMPLTIE